MRTFVARDSDGELNEFVGSEPEAYRVEPIGYGGVPSVAYRAGRGCSGVARLRREQFPDVRCGQCKEVVTMQPVVVRPFTSQSGASV